MIKFAKELHGLLTKHNVTDALRKDLMTLLNSKIEVCSIQRSTSNEMLRNIKHLESYRDHETRSVGFQFGEGIVKNNLFTTEILQEDFCELRKHTLYILKI